MKKIKVLFILSILFVFNSCRNSCEINGIKISELIKVATDEPYCDLVKLSLENDVTALKKISRLNIRDGAGYEHGYIMIQIIENIGEKKYTNAIKDFSTTEKKDIYSYLQVGLEYGGNKLYRDKKVKDILPLFVESINDDLTE